MKQFQASAWREGTIWVAQCLEIDIASQGDSQGEALANLSEALGLFFETASPEEIADRLRESVTVSPVNVSLG